MAMTMMNGTSFLDINITMESNNLTTANMSTNDSTHAIMQDQSSDVLDIITYAVCFVGLVANVLSIIATINIPHRQTTHSKLIISLGVSDSLIIFGVVYHYIVTIFARADYCIEMGKKLFINTALLATLINLLAMAFDHYFAIMKPLHYRRFMSRYRGNCIILVIWAISIFGGLLDIIIGLIIKLEQGNLFCEMITTDDFEMEQVILGVILIVLVGIVVIYMKIYGLVKQLMSRDQMLYQDEMHSYKAIVTTFLIIGTFILCWLPNCLFQIVMSVQVRVDIESVRENLDFIVTIHKIFFVVLLSNSICDPIIYAVRLTEVQKGYKQIFYRLFPSRRFSVNEEEFRHLHHYSNSDQRRSTAHSLLNDTNVFNEHDHTNKLLSVLANSPSAEITQNSVTNNSTVNVSTCHTEQNVDGKVDANLNRNLNYHKNAMYQLDDVTSEEIFKDSFSEDIDVPNEMTKMVEP